MPVVPRAQRTTGTDPLRPGYGDFAPAAAALSGSVPAAGYVLSNALGRLAEQRRRQADEVAMTAALGSLSDMTYRVLDDPKDGALRRTGENAAGIASSTDGAYEELKKQTGEIAATLNPRIRGTFEGLLARHLDQARGRLADHEASQYEALDGAETAATAESLTTEASAAWGAPEVVGRNAQLLKATLEGRARRLGLQDEARASYLREGLSGFHAAVVRRMLSEGQGVAASGYLEQHKGDMVSAGANGVTVLQGQVKAISDTQRVMKAADETTVPGDLEASLAAVRSKYGESPLRRDIENEVENRYGQSERIRAGRERDAGRSFYELWIPAGRDHRRVKPDAWLAMTPEQREHILRLEEHDQDERRQALLGDAAARAAAREAKQAQSSQAWGLLYAAAKRDPEAFATRDILLDPLFEYLKPDDAQSILKLQIDGEQAVRDGKVPSASVLEHMLVSTALQHDVLEDDQTTAERLADPEFDRMRRSFNEWRASLPKEPTTTEVQDRLDQMVVKIKMRTPRGRLFGLIPLPDRVAETAAYEVQVPKAHREMIEAALRAKGYEISEENVVRFYLQANGGAP